MFLGEFHHTIDAKGRVSIPITFRGDLHGGAVITRGLDGALFLFPRKEWKVLAHKLALLPLGKATSRAFARLMLSGAMEATPDRQGRLMIPEFLRTYAGLRTRAVIAGLYNRLEVWDETRWETYKSATENQAGTLAEQLSGLGL
jgi:MraZ protein